MKLTKKQQTIHNWFIKNPGYLKKGKSWLIANLEEFLTTNKSNIKDLEIGLKSAKIDYVLGSLNKSKSLKPYIIKTKVKTYNPIVTAKKVNIITSTKFDENIVLAIADMHEPFCKEGYMDHCIDIRNKYKAGRIILIGDEVDLCGVSQWEKDPDGFSAGTEAELAQSKMEVWYKVFPTAFVCIGNHTARPFRQAKANGVPKKFIKSYEEAWNAPKTWKWADSWEFNNVHYTHGTGYSGPGAAIRIATRHRQNTVIGHIHSEAGIQYSASKIDLVWGMQLGGAICDKSYAAHYAKDQLKKSIIGCGIIIDGKLPIYEPMLLK